MRKVIYSIIVTCMIVSFFVLPAYAEESSSDLLFKYGFIIGDNGDLMVDQNLTRAQACVLLSEMYGQKLDASTFIYIQTFSDVSYNDWFSHYVTYAKSKGWISGYPDGTFKPNSAVSKQEWSAMLMNALGYAYEWNTVNVDLNAVGIVFSANKSSALKRGEAFDAMWQALLIPAKDDVIPLGIKLNKLPSNILGTDTSGNTASDYSGVLDIDSYKTIGLTELEFTFNTPLKEKERLDLSHIDLQQEANFFLKPTRVVIADNQKSIRVIMNVPIIQNNPMTITFKNIEAQNGALLKEKKLSDIKFVDTILPQIKHAEVIGDYYIRVTFNEPIQSDEDLYPTQDPDFIPEVNLNDFVINDGKMYMAQIKLTDNNKVAIIQTAQKLEGVIKIKAQKTLKDYAGFNLYSTEVEAVWKKETTSPKIVSYVVNSPTEITVIWDQEIKLVNILQGAYYHNDPANTISQFMSEDQIDGKEMTLVFENTPFRAGVNKLYITSDAISNLNNTKNETQVVDVVLPADTTKPTIVGDPEILDTRTFVVYFSELLKNELNEINATNHYELKTNGGAVVKLSYVGYNANTNALTFTAAEDLLGDYVLTLNDIKDYYGNPLEDKSVIFSAKDMSIPEATNWSAKVFYTSNTEQNIIVTFDEPMQMSGKYSVLDRSNYTVNGILLSSLSSSSASIKKIDEQRIQITLARSSNGGINVVADADDAADGTDLVIGEVADISGNLTETDSNYVDLSEKSNITVEAFRYIGNNQFEIILSDPVVTVDPKDFEITKNGTIYSIRNYTLSEDEQNRSVITASLNVTIDNYLGFFLRTVGQNTKTAYGESFSPYSIYIQMTEYLATGLKVVSINGVTKNNIYYTKSTGIVSLEFTKTLDSNSISSLSFEIPGINIDRIYVSGNVLQLYIKSSDQNKVKQYMIVQQKYPIKDTEGVLLENLSSRIEFVY